MDRTTLDLGPSKAYPAPMDARARTALVALLALSGCSLFQGATRLEDMSADEFARYSERAAHTVTTVAQAAIQEGDFTLEAALMLADQLDDFATGNYAGTLGTFLNLDGYGAAALAIALSEMDAAFAYVDNVIGERGREVIRAVANELREME